MYYLVFLLCIAAARPCDEVLRFFLLPPLLQLVPVVLSRWLASWCPLADRLGLCWVLFPSLALSWLLPASSFDVAHLFLFLFLFYFYCFVPFLFLFRLFFFLASCLTPILFCSDVISCLRFFFCVSKYVFIVRMICCSCCCILYLSSADIVSHRSCLARCAGRPCTIRVGSFDLLFIDSLSSIMSPM